MSNRDKVLMHVVVTCSAIVEVDPVESGAAGIRCSHPTITSNNSVALHNGTDLSVEQLMAMGVGTVLRAAVSTVEGELNQMGLQAEVSTPAPPGMKQ